MHGVAGSVMAIKEGFMAVMVLVPVLRQEFVWRNGMEGMYSYVICILGVLVFMPEISEKIAEVLIFGEMVIMAIVLVLYAFDF